MPKAADFGVSPLGSFARCVHASLPRIDYLALYQARVVTFDLATLLVDVLPDDPDVPSMSGLQLRLGLPGAVLSLLPQGTTVMVGWSEGDPARPYACLPGGGEHVGAMTLNADALTLGGDTGAEPPVKGTSYRTAQAALNQSTIATLTGMAAACTGPLSPLQAGFSALAAALTTFEGQQAGFLATNVLVK
jgi:hypothetical protein